MSPATPSLDSRLTKPNTRLMISQYPSSATPVFRFSRSHDPTIPSPSTVFFPNSPVLRETHETLVSVPYQSIPNLSKDPFPELVLKHLIDPSLLIVTIYTRNHLFHGSDPRAQLFCNILSVTTLLLTMYSTRISTAACSAITVAAAAPEFDLGQ